MWRAITETTETYSLACNKLLVRLQDCIAVNRNPMSFLHKLLLQYSSLNFDVVAS